MPATTESPAITMIVVIKCLIMSASTSVTLSPTERSRLISSSAGRTRFEEVDVGTGDERRTRQSEGLQKLVGFSNTVLERLSLRQDHLELHKTAKVLDLVQMDPGSADEKHLASLDDYTSKSEHAPESVDQRPGLPAFDPGVLGCLGSLLISPFVRNQLPGSICKLADLEPTGRYDEEGIALYDDLPRAGSQPFRSPSNRVQVGAAGLDLNVS
jgi:hypothetical protein